MATYKPTIAKYKGKTQTIYVVYDQTYTHTYRGGVKHSRTQTRVKRVYISGVIINKSKPEFFRAKSGRRIYGVAIDYRTPVRGGFKAKLKARRYTKKLSKPVKRKKITVRKIVELPRNARNVRFTKKPPRGALMAIR